MLSCVYFTILTVRLEILYNKLRPLILKLYRKYQTKSELSISYIGMTLTAVQFASAAFTRNAYL